MLYLLKSVDNNYRWCYGDVDAMKVLFTGGKAECVAYGHWNYGIPKEQISKSLELLTNTDDKIEFKQKENNN